MQNWKIRKMSVKRINQWLSAIGKLIKHYEGKVRIKDCPLCMVFNGKGCEPCLWRIIEGEFCWKLKNRLYGLDHCVGHYRKDLRFKKWRIIRLGQLRNWKKIFKLELARRDV